MPSIRTSTNDKWMPIHSQHVGKDGHLQFFIVDWSDGTETYHLVRHDAQFWFELATAIFTTGTNLPSAMGLLQDFNKRAGKEGWHGRAGAVGLGFGSAIALAEWLKTKPYKREGYYDSSGEFQFSTLINIRDRNHYMP